MSPIKTSPLTHRELAINFPNFTRNQLNHSVLNTFHLSQEMVQCLSIYRACRLNGKQFNALLHDGIITQNEDANTKTDYQIVYSKCTPYQVKRAKEIKLSFRKPNSIWNIPPTVIVMISIDMDGIKES